MIKTRLTELVGLKYPIIQAGMGPYPVTSLCIAAANAGCLGLCSTYGTQSKESEPIVYERFCQEAHASVDDDPVTITKRCSAASLRRRRSPRAYLEQTSWSPPRCSTTRAWLPRP